MDQPRIFLDVSTLLRHWENADGISRTVAKLADYAIDQLPSVHFVYLGGDQPLLIRPQFLRRVIAGDCRIDLSYFPDPSKPRLRHRLPRAMRLALMWMQRPRRRALVWVDRAATEWPNATSRLQGLRTRLLNTRYRRLLVASDGSPIRLIHHDLAFEPIPVLQTTDVVVLPGSDWMLMSRLFRSAERPKIVALCHDIIPLLFPKFFRDRFVGVFRDCVEGVFARADLTMFTTNQVAADTRRYWQDRGLPIPPTTVVSLGADAAKNRSVAGALPFDLARGKYALLVSTIEPRKNHRLVFDVWKTLLDEGIPQQYGFKLVFVGRKGWMTEELVREMTSHPSYGSNFLILSDVDDTMLNSLYEACAFTIYPSLYEGFGLPIIESFLHGKAVIASSAGALRETVDGLSPCYDPQDEAVWRETFRRWICDPSQYKTFENEIQSRFIPRSWDDAARHFFGVIGERFGVSALVASQTAPVGLS